MKASQNIMRKKDDKVVNKTGYKKKGKGKKKSNCGFAMKSKFWLMRMREKQKSFFF